MTLRQPTPATLDLAAATYVTKNRTAWAPRTTVRKLAALRSWASWAGYEGILARYRGPKPERAVPHPLPGGMDDVKAMMAASLFDPRAYALVVLCGVLALRVGEAVTVRGADFNEHDCTLKVTGKGDKTRIIPVPADVADLLRKQIKKSIADGEPLVNCGTRHAYDILARLGAEAGVARAVSTHDLRSTALTAMYERSKDLRAVQEFAGHSSSSTTEIYTGITIDAMRKAQEGIL